MTQNDNAKTIIHNDDLPTMRIAITTAVGDFETLSIHLEASGENSAEARKNMAWLLKQERRLEEQRDL